MDELSGLRKIRDAAQALVDSLGWWNDGTHERVTWPVDNDGNGEAEWDTEAIALRDALVEEGRGDH